MSIKKSNSPNDQNTEELSLGHEAVPEGEENPQESLNESGSGTIKVTN